MKNRIYFITFPIIVFLLASCQQRLYFPDRANTPGLTQAMEGKATITLKPQTKPSDTSTQEDVNFGTGIDLAFAPMNNWGVIASYRQIINKKIVKGGNVFDNLDERFNGIYNGTYWELGNGLFTTYGSRGKAEIYAGYGNGSMSRKNVDNANLDFDTRYHRFFIQPALGMTHEDKFSLTLGFRVAVTDFYNFNATDPNLKYNIDGTNNDFTKSANYYIEPFLNMDIGYKYAKANIQIGATKHSIT